MRTNTMTLVTPGRLLRSLRKNPVILQTVLLGVTVAQAATPSHEPGEWSILEVLAHLSELEEFFLQRVQKILQEENPRLPLHEQHAPLARQREDQQDYTAISASFFTTRHTLIQILNDLSEEQWMRTGMHDELFSVSLKEVVLQVIMHDIDHIEQIAHLLTT